MVEWVSGTLTKGQHINNFMEVKECHQHVKPIVHYLYVYLLFICNYALWQHCLTKQSCQYS